jgi:CheY-like chemotaxis protein
VARTIREWLASRPEENISNARPHSGVRSSSRVLVVDDDPAVRTSMAEILRLYGYSVSEADGPDDALRMLAEGDVALVLLDLGLPLGKGLRLLDDLALLDIAHPPPVILVSGSTDVPVVDPQGVRLLAQAGCPRQARRARGDVVQGSGLNAFDHPRSVCATPFGACMRRPASFSRLGTIRMR